MPWCGSWVSSTKPGWVKSSKTNTREKEEILPTWSAKVKNPVIWHVAFSPPKKGQWWGRRFGHVSVFGWTNENWIHLDLNNHEFDLRSFYAHDECEDYLSFMLTHYTVLKLGVTQSRSFNFFQPMTCVSFVKHVLGVNSCALLPDTLFRILIKKHGAEIVNEGPKHQRNERAAANPIEGGS